MRSRETYRFPAALRPPSVDFIQGNTALRSFEQRQDRALDRDLAEAREHRAREAEERAAWEHDQRVREAGRAEELDRLYAEEALRQARLGSVYGDPAAEGQTVSRAGQPTDPGAFHHSLAGRLAQAGRGRAAIEALLEAQKRKAAAVAAQREEQIRLQERQWQVDDLNRREGRADDKARQDAYRKVLDLAAKGNVAGAQALAKASRINVPPQVLADGNLARSMVLAERYYPTSERQAARFVQAMRQNGFNEESALAAVGRPEAPDDVDDRLSRMSSIQKYVEPIAQRRAMAEGVGEAGFDGDFRATDGAAYERIFQEELQRAMDALGINPMPQANTTLPEPFSPPEMSWSDPRARGAVDELLRLAKEEPEDFPDMAKEFDERFGPNAHLEVLRANGILPKIPRK